MDSMRDTTRRFWTTAGAVALSLAALVPVVAQRGGGPGGGGGTKPSADHKARQPRPIVLGVSGGNATDTANGYCCSGTLGALVESVQGQFILSNSHVFAQDIEGGDVAEQSDPINQSGLVDVACENRPEDHVATLSTLSSINRGSMSAVDAALAAVVPGAVRTDGAILEIGLISSTPATAFLSQRVKKSGRTTGLTTSRVEALNATISVAYTAECAGPEYTTTYTGQIIVSNRGQKFIAGGDSGSLMVEDVANNPRAVGLLFAGSSSIAVANPIGDVLDYFGVTLVGQPGAGGADVADAATQQAAVHAVAAQERNAARLIRVPGAIGHAVGFGPNGVAIKVYVAEMSDRARQAIPNQIEGVPVVLEAVGPIRAIGSMGACVKR
jgi:hypothetical protein